MRKYLLVFALALSVLVSGASPAADSSVAVYLDTLKRHGVRPDGEGALQYLRELRPGADQISLAAKWIQELGSDRFQQREAATRQLLRLPIVPAEALSQAAEQGDLEVRWRAKLILDRSQAETAHVLLAALKVIASDPPDGATTELFHALPLCRTPYMNEAVHQALRASAGPNDVDLLKQKLNAGVQRERVAAAVALAACLAKDAADQLYPLLEDGNERLALEVARAIADHGDAHCLAALVRLLDSPDNQIRSEAALVLQALTGKNFGFSSYDSPDKRAAASAAWREWLNSESAASVLFFPVRQRRLARGDLAGNTLISTGSAGRVIEMDQAGNVVWSYDVDAWSAEKLTNGNALIASYNESTVLEVDRAGNIVWEFPGVKAMTAKPLLSGNILIADFGGNRVLEVNRKKEIVWQQKTPASCFDADRLPNGNTIYGCPNVVCEMTPDGKTVHEWRITGRLNGLHALDNGNVLVANYGQSKVYELTRDNQVVWEFSEPSPCDVFRLPNGHTLVATAARVIEIGLDNTTVREFTKAKYGSARQ